MPKRATTLEGFPLAGHRSPLSVLWWYNLAGPSVASDDQHPQSFRPPGWPRITRCTPYGVDGILGYFSAGEQRWILNQSRLIIIVVGGKLRLLSGTTQQNHIGEAFIQLMMRLTSCMEKSTGLSTQLIHLSHLVRN